MGNSSSSDDYHGATHSTTIDKHLEKGFKIFRKECKILLLGSRESGKSTIVKQTKIINQNGFSDKERADYRHITYKNLMESAQCLVLAMRKPGAAAEEPVNRDGADRIMDYDFDLISPASTYRFPEDLALSVYDLWRDPAVPKLLDEHASEFYPTDSGPPYASSTSRPAKISRTDMRPVSTRKPNG